MAIFQKVQTALSDAGSIPFTVEGNELIIPRSDENGFEIRVAETLRGILVVCGNWHDHLDSEQIAVGLVLSAMTPICRVRTVYRGRQIARCYIEFLKEDGWQVAGARGVLLCQFWQRPREEIRSNSWVSPDELDPEVFEKKVD